MQRTLIYLPKSVLQKRFTRQLGRRTHSVGAILRAHLVHQSASDGRTVLQSFVDWGKSLPRTRGPHDLAKNIKRYLYGDKSKWARR